MPRPKKPPGEGAPIRSDGRRAMLTYMKPTMIKSIKTAALDRDTTAFIIIEQAAQLWLETEGELKKSRKPTATPIARGAVVSDVADTDPLEASNGRPATDADPERTTTPARPKATSPIIPKVDHKKKMPRIS